VSDLLVRHAAPGDRAALEALWAAFMAEQAALDARVMPAEDAPQRARTTFMDLIRGEGGTAFVAESGGAVVGFLVATWFHEAPVYAPVAEVHLDELYVVPALRRQGVAVALLTAAKAWAHAAGAVRLRMHVLWHNEASRRLVARWGATPLAVSFTREVSG
jgi:GNAT superfamily N-acetyltransferase